MEPEAALRERLISHLRRADVLHSPAVAAAMQAVPRHRFIPGVSREEAYADRAIAIKMRGDEIVSSISQPGMIAQMLELLAPAPGNRVLEVGTGSGYNSALLAEIVGTAGSVTTLELDTDLAERADGLLHELGYRTVRVVAADGARELPETARYDRIVVTARTDDVAATWWQALRDGGRLVVPLRLEGVGEYALGFVRDPKGLRSVGAHPCAFIALREETPASKESDVFYRDPLRGSSAACVRRIAGIVAVRREDATPALLAQADVVVARPVTVFAVTFD